MIDHIDKNKSNNKKINLREVSCMCNLQNQNLKSNNISGVSGVNYDKNRNLWKVQIYVNKKQIYLGYFDNFDDAVKARYNEELSNPLWTCSTESSAYLYLKEKGLV